jgi:hypothetical protein
MGRPGRPQHQWGLPAQPQTATSTTRRQPPVWRITRCRSRNPMTSIDTNHRAIAVAVTALAITAPAVSARPSQSPHQLLHVNRAASTPAPPRARGIHTPAAQSRRKRRSARRADHTGRNPHAGVQVRNGDEPTCRCHRQRGKAASPGRPLDLLEAPKDWAHGPHRQIRHPRSSAGSGQTYLDAQVHRLRQRPHPRRGSPQRSSGHAKTPPSADRPHRYPRRRRRHPRRRLCADRSHSQHAELPACHPGAAQERPRARGRPCHSQITKDLK